MFVAEMIAPFFIFVTGEPRIIAGATIWFLMIGIWLTGNYGFFNILTMVLCISLLDTHITYAQIHFDQLFSTFSSSVISIFLIIHFLGSLIHFPFNNWCTRTWLHWVSFMRINNTPLQILLKFYRALGPFRIVHSYGVFPPFSAPAVRWIPLMEGSHDGENWKEYEYHFIPSQANSPPKFIAPYHPRFDHLIYYESPGFNGSNFYISNIGLNNPYVFSKEHMYSKISQRLLEGEGETHKLFKSNPFPDTNNPPKMIRVRNFLLEPTSPAALKQSGHWVKRVHVGVHYPAFHRDDSFWQRFLPDPENFHWDDWIWKYRSKPVKTMIKHFKHYGHQDQAIEGLDGISPHDINSFWNEFLPRAMPQGSRDFKNLKRVTEDLKGAYNWPTLRKYERIFSAYSILLFDNLSPYFFNQKKPSLDVKSSFHFALIIYEAIGGGKETYLKLFDNPEKINQCAADLNINDGLYFFGLFQYSTLEYHARRIRVTQRVGNIPASPEISGFFEMIPFIVNQFEPDEDEQLPVFSRTIKDGQWIYHSDENPKLKPFNVVGNGRDRSP